MNTIILLAALAVNQVFEEPRYVRGDTNLRILQEIDKASWVWSGDAPHWGVAEENEAVVRRFRRKFTSDGAQLRFQVSADERFILFLDGKEISRGPNRGLPEHWYYQSYEVSGLEKGEHTFEAVVWQLGGKAALAQLSYRGGFIFAAQGGYDEQLTTGKAKWEVGVLKGTKSGRKGAGGTFGVGADVIVKGTGVYDEQPEKWEEAVVVRGAINVNDYGAITKGWKLFPADRLDQMHELKTPGRVVNAKVDLTKPFTVKPGEELDLYWDLDNYYCAYPEIEVSGGKGAEIRWGWAESLRNMSKLGMQVGNNKRRMAKENRNEWKGKEFGEVPTDTFYCDGREKAVFSSLWWRCGRWCRLTIKGGETPLEVKGVRIAETRYPFKYDYAFESDDELIAPIMGICRRAIEMCSHEMFFDCPYYEQQMYPGDTRIQLQVINTLTRDDRLTKFALSVYDWDRRSDGMVDMNFPTRGTQESSTYTMCWIMMFKDYLMWHGDLGFLRVRMPGVRNALMGLALYENKEGLLEDLPGWSFMDWVKEGELAFDNGVSPCGRVGQGVSVLNNLQYLLAIQSAQAVDEALGEEMLAAHWRVKGEKLARKLVERFWDEGRGALADTIDKDRFSEHAQAMAILGGILDSGKRERALAALVKGEGLAPVSSYFAYYLFEALAQCGRADIIRERLVYWKNYLDWGARTAFETQKCESRSDCHGWSACPLYFLQTAFAGVRPSSVGFETVAIAPQPAGMKFIKSKTPTPKGIITMELEFLEDGSIKGWIELPAGMRGMLTWQGAIRPLISGRNEIK